MLKKKKAQIIDGLQQVFAKSSMGILTDYRGMPAPEVLSLRRKLRESGIDYKIVKNTLAQLAARKAGKGQLASLFNGPVAVAFGYGETVEPAKLLIDYIGNTKTNLSIKGGFLNDSLLSADEVRTVSTLPPRKVLLSRVVGGMQLPVAVLISSLSSPMQGIIGVLEARIHKLEGG